MNESSARTPVSRRRFWRNTGIAALVASALAGIGLTAHGHGWHRCGPGECRPGMMDPAQMEQRVERMLKHLYVEIDASEEQKPRLAAIARAAAGDLAPLRERRLKAREQARSLLTAENIDRPAVEAFVAEQVRAGEAIATRMARALTDAAEVLTPAQRQKLAEHFERFGQRRGW